MLILSRLYVLRHSSFQKHLTIEKISLWKCRKCYHLRRTVKDTTNCLQGYNLINKPSYGPLCTCTYKCMHLCMSVVECMCAASIWNNCNSNWTDRQPTTNVECNNHLFLLGVVFIAVRVFVVAIGIVILATIKLFFRLRTVGVGYPLY